MDYKVLMLTVPGVIPTRTESPEKYEPWSRYGSIDLRGGTLSTIEINDTDSRFENVNLSKGTEVEQRLVTATTFGQGSSAITYPAGTQLTYGYCTIIQDTAGNVFLASFPRVGTSLVAQEIGGKSSVLIFPQASKDASGNPVLDSKGQPVYPQFDLNTACRSTGHIQFSSANSGLTYSYPTAAADCFAGGTIIDTIFGPRAVETLSEGDMVRTRDNGMRWLGWIGCTHLSARQLDLMPNLRPVRIAAGALGGGLPAAVLTVSPQHRILVSSAIARRIFGENEVLVAAKHLVGLPGITVENPADGIDYWHILFDGHELVRSNGAWTESLFTGAQAMEGVGDAARREIFTLFPELAAPGFRPQGARRFLTGREGRQLARHHGNSGKALIEMS